MLLVIGLITFIIVLNAVASAITLLEMETDLADGNDVFLSVGMSVPLYETAVFLSVISMFVGVISIAEEKKSGSLRVLIAKPLYRRDILAGKFLGLSMLLLYITIFLVMLCVSTLVICYRPPLSVDDFLLRTFTYIIVLFLGCELTLGISMLIGVIFKNLYTILIFAGAFLCLDWIFMTPAPLAVITSYTIPAKLCLTTISGGFQTYLFDTVNPYNEWLNGAAPYLVVMIVEIVLVFLISSFVFTRNEA